MIVPYSTDWWQARLGKVTASRIADMTARLKNGEWGASRGNYASELIAERLTGRVAASYSNAAMEWGTCTEPHALIAYKFFTDRDALPCGYIDHPRIAMSGASPDAAVFHGSGYPLGLIEIKCPNTKTHIDTLRRGVIAGEYWKQMLWQMACCPTAAWVDFVSFDPRMPEDLQLFVKRVRRDEEAIDALEQQVVRFLAEIDTAINDLWSGTSETKSQLKRSVKLEVVRNG